MTGPSQSQNGDDGSGKPPKPGTHGSEPHETELSDRLEKLQAGLEKARPKSEAKPAASGADTSAASGLTLAYRLGAEFVSGVLVGGALGYGIDHVFGIAPWGMIVFLLIGFGAGVLNMMRAAGPTGGNKGQKR